MTKLIAATMDESGVIHFHEQQKDMVETYPCPIYPRLSELFMPAGFSCMHPTEKDVDGGDRVV